MKKDKLYTSQLAAGSGVIDETRALLDLWQPGMKTPELFQTALDSGYFSNVSARRLRNLVSECFSPRYLGEKEYPAFILKALIDNVSSTEFSQLLFLFTARANMIFSDFVKMVYWGRYLAGHDSLSNEDAKKFVIQANQDGRTVKPWSESTIERAAGYLTRCCADFGMLETGRKRARKIIPFRVEQKIIALLAYDAHFAGFGDNAVMTHPDWELFGLQKEDLRAEFKRLSFKGFFITQMAGDFIRIEWKYKNWEELIHVISEC